MSDGTEVEPCMIRGCKNPRANSDRFLCLDHWFTLPFSMLRHLSKARRIGMQNGDHPNLAYRNTAVNALNWLHKNPNARRNPKQEAA